jgi:hypothetical protein
MPSDVLSVGVVARSEIKMKMDGTVKVADTPVDS